MKIGDWVQTKEDAKTSAAYWPRDLDPNTVGYISSLKCIERDRDHNPRDLWNVSFRLDQNREVTLEFYTDEMRPADAVTRLAKVSADELKLRVIELKKGQILLVEFGMSNVPPENAQRLVEAWREEIYKVAEKAGISSENFPLLLVAGHVEFTTIDAVELLGLVGKTAG